VIKLRLRERSRTFAKVSFSGGRYGRKDTLKILPSFLILIFWISSWFPTSLDRGAIFVAVFCIIGLMAAHLSAKPQNKHARPSKTTAALAVALLIIGALLALMTWAEGTSANGAILLFYVLGVAGYLLLVSAILSHKQTSPGYRRAGGLALCLLASWSWASAIGMYSHRGAEKQASHACILVPNPSEYDRKLNSIWEMRLPHIGSRRTSPSGSYVWEYHAILVAQVDRRTELYNWSKKWIRFERLDPARNPYLPTNCP
jgi:hypothetical protein